MCQNILSYWAAQLNFFASPPKSSNSTSSPSAVPLILWFSPHFVVRGFSQISCFKPTAPSEDWQHFLMWQKQLLSPLLDLTQIQIALQLLFILSRLTKPSLPWALPIFGFTLRVAFLRGRRGSFNTECIATITPSKLYINNLHVTQLLI